MRKSKRGSVSEEERVRVREREEKKTKLRQAECVPARLKWSVMHISVAPCDLLCT